MISLILMFIPLQLNANLLTFSILEKDLNLKTYFSSKEDNSILARAFIVLINLICIILYVYLLLKR